jgi:hypothetical protein
MTVPRWFPDRPNAECKPITGPRAVLAAALAAAIAALATSALAHHGFSGHFDVSLPSLHLGAELAGLIGA